MLLRHSIGMVAWSSWVCWILKPCGMMIEHSKLFTMRTLTAGSAKQSIKFEIFPCMGYISFFLCYKHNRFTNWADIVVNLHLLKSSMIEPFVVPQRDCFLQISIFQKKIKQYCPFWLSSFWEYKLHYFTYSKLFTPSE